jgi:hypothetical protein
MLRCCNPRCGTERDTAFEEFWNSVAPGTIDPEQKHVYNIRRKWFSKDMSCDLCGAKNYIYACPHCHNELPLKLVEEGADIISVIGGPQSGKSHYIIALLHELRENGFEIGLNATLQQVGQNREWHTETMYQRAIERINRDHSVLDKTEINSFSLPWIIRIDSTDPLKRGKQNAKKSVFLVFYDTAGENFSDPQEIKKNANYLQQSKAVIVLFDTLSIPQIKKILEVNNEDTSGSENATPFETTWTALDNFIKSENEHLKDKPFAFVMSKFDVVLNHSDDLNFSIQGFRDGRGNPIDKSYINGQRKFNVRQVESAHELISNALSDRNIWKMPKYPEFVEQYWGDNGRFFGMSALGSMPDGAEVCADGMQPYRVMDPLLWIMSKLGGFAFETIDE